MEEHQKGKLFHHSLMAMNSQMDIIFWDIPLATANKACSSIAQKMSEIELTLSRYNEEAEVFQINYKAGKQPIKVSYFLWSVLQKALVYFQKTNGYFDISLGTSFHHFKHLQEEIIARGAFEENVVLDQQNQTIKFSNSQVSLDFGGIGKGVALDHVAEIVDSFEISNAFISFGGSSVLTRGKHPHGEYWPFSLAGKVGSEKIWQLNNHCISVSKTISGAPGENALHIFNPVTGKVVQQGKTVVVKSKNATDAEVLSTALVAAPLQ